MNLDTKIKSIEKKLDVGINLPHQALDIANQIFRISLSPDNQTDFLRLKSNFLKIISNVWNVRDLLFSQVRYAIKIADSKGELEYEEMHKLFSLCDDIYILESFGFTIEENLKNDYQEVIRGRFKKESGKAKMVSEDKKEDWNKGLWWYKEH